MSLIDKLIDKKNEFVFEKVKNSLNEELVGVGEISELRFQIKEKRVILTITLDGEINPIQATVNDFHIKDEREDLFLTFSKITTSRNWLNTLINDKLKIQRIPVPEEHADEVKLLALLI